MSVKKHFFSLCNVVSITRVFVVVTSVVFFFYSNVSDPLSGDEKLGQMIYDLQYMNIYLLFT